MKKGNNKETKVSTLRRRAEKQLAKTRTSKGQHPENEDPLKLIHELQVHQIELEMQNEELMQARAEIETSLEKYSDLYDFAPAGYFTLTDEGIIREVNLTGSTLLGKDRSRLIGRRFDLYVSEETRLTFFTFLRKVCAGITNETCEVALSRRKKTPLYIHIEGTAMEAGKGMGRLCLMSVLDITERKMAEDALRKAKVDLEKRVMERTTELQKAYDQLQLELTERTRAEEKLGESEQRFRLMFERHQAVMLLIDPESGAIVDANHAAEEFYGYPRATLTTMKIADINQLPPEIVAAERQRAKLEARNYFVFPHLLADGEIRTVEVHSTPIVVQGELLLFSIVHDITERRKAEEALRKKTEELNHFFNITLDLLAIAGTDGYFRRLNLAWERTLGYSLGELMSRPFLDFIHPEDVENTREAVAMLASQQEVINFQNRYRRRDGTYRWIEWAAAPSGNLIYCSARDITERKRTERHLRKEAERSNLFLELYLNAPQMSDKELYDHVLERAVMLTDSAIGFFHLVDHNRKSIILTTWNSEALKNCTAAYNNHYPIDQAGNWVDSIRLQRPVVYNDYQSSPHRRGFPEGHTPIMRFMSIPVLENGKARIIFGVGNKAEEYEEQDIDQLQLVAHEMLKIIKQRRSDDALLKSEESYRTLFNSVTDAIFVHEIDASGVPGPFLEVNTVACERLGYSRVELLTMSPYDIDAPVSETGFDLFPSIRKLMSGMNVTFEQVHVTKDGRRIPVEISCCKGSLYGRPVVISLVRDITERAHAEEEKKRLTTQLIQAKKMEALGTLAASIAHDLNNILQPILINSDLISDTIPHGSQVREYLDQIIDAAQIGKNMVKQIKAFGSGKKGSSKPIALGQVVNEALIFFKRSLPPHINFRQNITAKGSIVQTNPTQVHQMIVNLCANAIQAMNPGKDSLEVSLHETDITEAIPAIVNDLKPGRYVKLMVSDTGSGIDPEEMDRIFDPFFTTKKAGMGTGLGLAVVHEVVKNAHGSILLSSEVGKGTRFEVYFPLYLDTKGLTL
jgi:PAS domain S-box-containing protein